MPPEEDLREDFVEETEKRCRKHKEGKMTGTVSNSPEEVHTFFKDILDENGHEVQR